MFNTVHFSTVKSSRNGVSDIQKLTNISKNFSKVGMWLSTRSIAEKGIAYLTITVGAGSSKNYKTQTVMCNSMIDLDSKQALDPNNQEDIDFVNQYIDETVVEEEFKEAFFVKKKVVYVYLLRNLANTYISTNGDMFANSSDDTGVPMNGNLHCYKNVNFDKAFAKI